jgi:hypothetical protein
VRWQSTDTAVICLMNSSDPACSKTPPPPPPPAPGPGPGSGGLKAGLGVGIPLLVFAILVGAWFLWRRYQNEMRNLPTDGEQGQRPLSEPAARLPGILTFWNRPKTSTTTEAATGSAPFRAYDPPSELEKPKDSTHETASELHSGNVQNAMSKVGGDAIYQSHSARASELDAASTTAAPKQSQSSRSWSQHIQQEVEVGFSLNQLSPTSSSPPHVPPKPAVFSSVDTTSVPSALQAGRNRRYPVPRKEVPIIKDAFRAPEPASMSSTSDTIPPIRPLPSDLETSSTTAVPITPAPPLPPLQMPATTSSQQNSSAPSISSVPTDGDYVLADLASVKERIVKIREEKDRISRLQELSWEEERLKQLEQELDRGTNS